MGIVHDSLLLACAPNMRCPDGLQLAAKQLLAILCVADRDMLKLTQQEFVAVPILVKLEVLVAGLACMWGKI